MACTLTQVLAEGKGGAVTNRLKALSPIFDPTFSDSSFGFRPGRSAHHAVYKAREHIRKGYRIAFDMDLSNGARIKDFYLSKICGFTFTTRLWRPERSEGSSL
jgi:hypothetical protein